MGSSDRAVKGKHILIIGGAICLTALSLTVFRVLTQPTQESRGKAYYISPSGSDNNDGSSTHPFATISKAATLATSGTTIHVAPGIYRPFANYVSGTSTSRVIFVSDVKWGAKITASSFDSSTGRALLYNSGNYVDIQGFELYGGNGFVGILNEGSYDRVSGNKVHDIGVAGGCNGRNGGAGIDDANYSASDDDIIGNVVYNIGPVSPYCNGIHGIYHANLRGHIYNNISYNNAAWGIHLWHAANAVTVANNLVFGNRAGGIILGAGDAPGGVIIDNSVVSNNIAYNNAHYGIAEYQYPGQKTIGVNNRFLNNLVYGNPTSFLLLNGNTHSGDVTSNPQFVNYQPDGNGDYHLKPTSPAIDTGTSRGAPNTDFAGNPRPQGKGFDIGPYER